MRYLTLLEKLKILIDVLMTYKFVLVLIAIMLILTILFIFKKLSNKKYTILMSLSILLTLIISIIGNYKILFKTFDNFTTIFFSGIYFPSIYIYLGVLLVVAVAFITSILSTKKKKVYKIINSIAFILNNIFFIIVLNIIAKNSINVFEISSLYTNSSLVAILELNMGLFILWIFSLSAAYITNTICDKITSKKTIKEEIISKVKEPVPKEAITPETIPVKEEVSLIEENIKVPEVTEIKEELPTDTEVETNNKITFNDILNGLVPVTYYDTEVNNKSYNITNPQKIYEDNYNNLKLELEKDSPKIEKPIIEKVPEVKIKNVKTKVDKVPEVKVNIIKEKDIIGKNILSVNLNKVEDKTLKIKEENMKKNLISNTISLNDLVEKEEKTVEPAKQTIISNDTSYTLNDYKKIIAMLKEIKNNSNKNNISIDDAITMSLISNYSIDDCVKFKEILESNLN